MRVLAFACSSARGVTLVFTCLLLHVGITAVAAFDLVQSGAACEVAFAATGKMSVVHEMRNHGYFSLLLTVEPTARAYGFGTFLWHCSYGPARFA